MRRSAALAFAVVAWASIMALAFSLVYHARWWDEDSDINAAWIREVAYQGSFTRARSMYGNGYGYQVASAILTQAAGVDARWYVLIGNPLLAGLLSIVLYAVYKRVAGAAAVAGAAVALLFTVPEFLFVYSRATHEKFSLTLILLVVAGLVGPLRRGGAAWAASVLVYAFALSSMNAYFSLMPAAAIAGAAAAHLVLARGEARLRGLEAAREASVILPLLLLIPAANILYVIRGTVTVVTGMADLARNLVEGLLRGLLGGEEAPAAAYAAARVYEPHVLAVLEAPTAALLGLTALTGLKRLLGRGSPSLYESAAVAVLAAAGGAVAADLAGGLFGSRTLIVRAVPIASVVAAPVAASALATLASRASVRAGVPAILVLALILTGLAVPGHLKATRSPLVSSHIPYYTTAEEGVLEWLTEYNRDFRVYLDVRLRSVLYLYEPNADFHYLYVTLGSPYYLYVKRPWEARAIALSSEMLERGVYTGLAPTPVSVFLEENYNVTLDSLPAEAGYVYSNTHAFLALLPEWR